MKLSMKHLVFKRGNWYLYLLFSVSFKSLLVPYTIPSLHVVCAATIKITEKKK